MGKITKSTEELSLNGNDRVFGWKDGAVLSSDKRQWKWSTVASGIATLMGITNYGSGKIITDSERSKLNGIATGAQVNVVNSVLGRTGVVVATASDYDADQVDYDNTNTPSLSPTPANVQTALERIYSRTELSQDLSPVLGGDLDPSTFAYAGALRHTGSTVGFYSATPIAKPTALTAQLTTISQAGSFTPEYTIQAMTNTTPFGFVSLDEAETVLSVIQNLQTRVSELESRIQSLGLIS
jgi:hypothetical protein